jgi:hypothetical protein
VSERDDGPARHRAAALRRGRRARRLSPHAREVDRALALLAAGELDWQALAGDVVGLEDLAGALQAPSAGEARKLVVEPSR